jgi:hypothetical protein
VAVGAAAAEDNESSESSGLPGWAWALIGAGTVALAVLGYGAIRRHRRDDLRPPPGSPPPDQAPPGTAAS